MFSGLASIRASNAAKGKALASRTSSLPVAIFVGGTSGIGEGMAKRFADHTGGNAHIVIIGRNQKAADSIIASFPKPTPSGADKPTYEFVQCDVSLMKNIHSVTSSLLPRYPKINYLVMSPGYMTTAGREETNEGIDKKLAVHYYARWAFVDALAPALQKAADEGEEATAFAVLASGKGGEIDVNDLGLKKSYSLANAALAAPTYNDLMMEEFSSKYPTISFQHAYPGVVRTEILRNSPSATLRYSSAALMALSYPFMTSKEECGDYLLHALFNNGPGVWRVGSKGEDLKNKRYFGSEESRKKLWEHTEETIREAVA